ncbi:hypothetical protein JHK82_055277 [Glycine max]|nr:hypothetical protein JHK86_055114 [Glycine max]KAG4917803.1 hypothetical protein JHK85_056084 [Glycine max]KAG5073904.1 hypothetical protein JHK84_055135 [Glycine max]KAG5076582.1 hypothetical protein JHK82_055277 [Glycine max]
MALHEQSICSSSFDVIQSSSGLLGSDLANVVNEAVLLATCRENAGDDKNEKNTIVFKLHVHCQVGQPRITV